MFSIFHHFDISIISLFSAMAYVGLLLIALGTGGIKPCVASFGGEQFKVNLNYLFFKKLYILTMLLFLFSI